MLGDTMVVVNPLYNSVVSLALHSLQAITNESALGHSTKAVINNIPWPLIHFLYTGQFQRPSARRYSTTYVVVSCAYCFKDPSSSWISMKYCNT
jgi:hypothetical protein